jgi:hypothetical protein
MGRAVKIGIYAPSACVAGGSAPAVPLWQVAPTRDSEGCLLTDFMMLIPRLRDKPRTEIERTSGHIHDILARHRDVVFADLNLKLNLLWISLRPRQGAISEISAAIRVWVPEAVLVAHHAELR